MKVLNDFAWQGSKFDFLDSTQKWKKQELIKNFVETLVDVTKQYAVAGL